MTTSVHFHGGHTHSSPPAPASDLTDAVAPDIRLDGRVGTAGNRIFAALAGGAGILILATLAAVAIFLAIEAWPALTDSSARFRAMGQAQPVSLLALTGPQLFGTVLGAVLAMVLAVPLSVGIALFITQYAPARLAGFLAAVIDLLAAIPSVVFGLWGGLWLLPKLAGVWTGMREALAWLPIGTTPASPTGRVLASAAVILAVMIIPIVTAISRDIFAQTPRSMHEAALALGATTWERLKLAVLPYGRGIISASMLGLGRALGETMAVVMVLSVGATYSFDVFASGAHSTIAANIALQFPEASGLTMSALIATGLALFAVTMVVNMLARLIIARTRAYSGANA
ncbi:phosphate ABC transporter permease subunit PstC [Nanchangia anserum]|uniref:phosphate ABC transporter permease subunit PstC n=1 Tax=Nanchangia anserum TaxID=2692125 RepID=UPI0018846B4A|nr:phosphate ABC transporter permease subunit PstC [Nanchangia anserum]QOX81504.1 phosphate ABC transporter permease subunit PstC [Nanchangia anserum]